MMEPCTLNLVHLESVKIQSIIDPATFWIITNEKEPPSRKLDQLLTSRVEESIPLFPEEGQMVAVKNPATEIWHRGKVETVFSQNRYKVFLVDYGTELKVDQSCIRQLPKEVIFNKKHYATLFKLHGIVPCNKRVRTDAACEGGLKLVSDSGKTWDPVASKFITNKLDVATAIHLSIKEGLPTVKDLVLGDLHFVIGGRCISMTDDLCSNQYAIYNEALFNDLLLNGSFGRVDDSPTKPNTTSKELESAKFSISCNDAIASCMTPGTSRGGRPSSVLNVKSVETPVGSPWVVPSKEQELIPAGMTISNFSRKVRKPPQPQTTSTRYESKSPLVSNSPNARKQNIAPAQTSNSYTSTGYSQGYTTVEDVKEVKQVSPTVCNVPSSSSRYSSGAEGTLESIQVKSPHLNQTINHGTSVVPEQNQAAMMFTPKNADLEQRLAASSRGQRLKAKLLSSTNKSIASANSSANDSLEIVPLNSSVDSPNVSDNGSSPSGLFSKIEDAFDKTKGTDSTLGVKPIHSPQTMQSPQSPKVQSPGNNTSKETNKFLRYSDASSESVAFRNRRRICTAAEISNAPRVLVHGADIDIPVANSGEIQSKQAVHFHPVIQKGLDKMQVKDLTRIQSAVCPALLGGENAIIVHPSRSGKTFAYIAPLLSSLLCKEKYSKLPAGNGPLAVVLCPSAYSCELVGLDISALLQSDPTKLNALTVFGGQDQEQMVKLTNGCHLLVTTPLNLLRVLSISSLTDLSRICHLVLDEADTLLYKFHVEIQNILEKCNRSKRNRERKGIYMNIQVVTASHKWCPALKNLLKLLAPTPLICIGSYLEMAIYAKLQPKLMVLNSMEKRSQLTEIVAANQSIAKILVVCQTPFEVKEVISFLKPTYPKILRADQDMDNKEMLETLPRWRTHDITSYPILVCTDAVLSELKISDASCLIHYSLPEKKSQFANRFSCLMKNVPNIYKAESSNCKVCIFISDENRNQFPGTLSFMKRLGATILPELEIVSKEVLLENEHRKETFPLCNNLLSFGECWKKNGCSLRHAIMDSDKPIDFPEKGLVKLKFLHARTASHIMARLLEHTDVNGKTHSLRNNYLKIMMQMRSHFASPENKTLHGHPVLGDICAYEDDNDVFHRVEVNEIRSYNVANKPEYVHILFIDIGRAMSCHTGKLFAVPTRLKEIPPLAVNVFICRVRPRDRDDIWSKDSCKKMDKWLRKTDEIEEDGPFIIGNIKMSLRNSLWLDPIQGRQCTPDIDSSKTGLLLEDFRHLMLDKKVADDNPEHLTKIYALCQESGVSIPDYTAIPASTKSRNNSTKRLPDPQWAFIPDEDFTEVFFTSAQNPGVFFVCICKFTSSFKRLTNEIQKHVAEYKPVEDDLVIHTGVYCLGRFPDDHLWYRAKVLSVTDDGRVELFFLDHGDSAVVGAAADIVPIQPKHIISLPFQAIECSLAGIEPIGGECWSEEATDELYELTVNLKTDYRKPMYLTPCGKDKANNTGGHKYNILLACKDDDEKNIIVLNELFVKNGFAKVSDNGIERDSLDRLIKNVKEDEELSEEKDDDGVGGDDPGSCPEPVDKQSEASYSDTESESNASNSGAIVPASKSPSQIADELYDGIGDFDFEYVDEDGINAAEMFIRDFLNLGPKEDSSRGECAPNQCLPPKERNVSIVEVSNTDSPLPVLYQNVASAATTNTQESSSALSKTPIVIWHQDQIYITMSVDIPNIDDKPYKLDVGKRSVTFTAIINEETYSFYLELYGAVYNELCEHASTGRTVRIRLQKIVPGNWERLQKLKKHLSWLKHNMDFEDDTGEDYIRVNTPGQRPLVHHKKDICVDLLDEESDDSEYEEEDREFERRDFFNPLS